METITSAFKSASEAVKGALGLKKADAAAQYSAPTLASAAAPVALGTAPQAPGETSTGAPAAAPTAGGRRRRNTRGGKRHSTRKTTRRVRKGKKGGRKH
uniref:Uncharacterized protein n=1 Tax=viral metagenome TaxID=1070528 RepID=A0A6C0AIV0_9ZZZZ